MRNIKYGIRSLFRAPGLVAAAIITLALGFGVNTAIFTVLNGVLLRPLPFHDPDRLVWIWSTRVDRDKAFFSVPDYLDFQRATQTLDAMAAYGMWGVSLTGQDEPERLQGIQLSANSFGILGVEAAAGRALTPQDEIPGAPRVVMLSHSIWQRRFGGAPEAVGRTITLNGDSYTVIGVLPPAFLIPGADVDVAAPLAAGTDPRRTDRGTHFLRVFARMKPGITRAQAAAEMDAITARLREMYPLTNAKKTAPRVLGLAEEVTGSYRAPLIALAAAAGLTLLIACSNLAGLIVARGSAREREMAIRASLGASRIRLASESIIESGLLACGGLILAFALAAWGVPALLRFAPADLPRLGEVSFDRRGYLFAFAVAAFSMLLVGLTPALRASRVQPGPGLGSRGASEGPRGMRARRMLVASQVALSLILLAGAGLLAASFVRLRAVRAGFETRDLRFVRLSLPKAKYADADALRLFWRKLSERLHEAGAESAALANALPLSGQNVRSDFTIVGHPPRSPLDMPAAQNRWVTPGYFHAMEIPVAEGREFTEFDTARGARVAVVDRALARRFFPNGGAVGARLRIDDGEAQPREVEVIGVVGDVKHNRLDDDPSPTMYSPVYQIHTSALGFLLNSVNVVTRGRGDTPGVRAALRAVDGEAPASVVRRMEDALAATLAPRRFQLWLIGVFAVCGALLAAGGLYGVVSYSVARRRREIGIRVALGAGSGEIVRLILGEAIQLAAVGVAAGLCGALALSQWIRAQLFGVSAVDPAIFLATAGALFVLAVASAWAPAWRAARIDPLTALHGD